MEELSLAAKFFAEWLSRFLELMECYLPGSKFQGGVGKRLCYFCMVIVILHCDRPVNDFLFVFSTKENNFSGLTQPFGKRLYCCRTFVHAK
jgi:hypothetical protein